MCCILIIMATNRNFAYENSDQRITVESNMKPYGYFRTDEVLI